MAIAPENNPPINPEYFQPSKFTISNITYGKTTLITMVASTTGGFTVNPNYVVGQLVRLLVPVPYGASSLNGVEGYVTSVPTTLTVIVNIDSRGTNPFVSSPGTNTPPQIVAVGDINSGPTNTGRTNNQTYISGSFINISPL